MPLNRMLVVLLDGVPFEKISPSQTPFLASLRTGPVEPGMGFSINIYAELFAGRTPDDLGYFNKWTLRTREEAPPPGWLNRTARRVLDWPRFFQPASRVAHKLHDRIMRKGNTANIPFSLLPYLKQNPAKEIFWTTEYPTLFNRFNPWEFVLCFQLNAPLRERDRLVAHQTMTAIQSGSNVFVLMADLDGIAHRIGLGRTFDEHLTEVDTLCEQMVSAFRAVNGDDAGVVFLSDHGMSSTHPSGKVSVDLVSEFGPVGYDTYHFFVDALMLRVWVHDEQLRERIHQRLATLAGGRVLEAEERRRYGISDPEFGHLIYLLDEGRAFFPSFFGATYPKAMHGYDPTLASQQAFIAAGGIDAALPRTAREVYTYLATALGETQVRPASDVA